jgi:hypothetical protein
MRRALPQSSESQAPLEASRQFGLGLRQAGDHGRQPARAASGRGLLLNLVAMEAPHL